MSAVDFAKLLQAGTWTTLRKGATLQEEGQPSASVFLLVSGGADVAVGGKKVLSRKGKHQFIGDAGLSLGIAIAEPVRGIATLSNPNPNANPNPSPSPSPYPSPNLSASSRWSRRRTHRPAPGTALTS